METEVILTGIAAAPIIAALVSTFKPLLDKIGGAPIYPIAALALGIAWNVCAALAIADDPNIGVAALIGVTVGLAAGGVYGANKTYLQ